MFRIILTIADILPASVVLVPLFGLFYLTILHLNLRKTILYCLFCLYLSAVFSLVGIPNIRYIRPEVNLNLIPFAGMISDLKNGILNIALFVPFGFFLPMLWHPYRKLNRCALIGLLFSLTIELLQLLTFRATDVNDLITNVIGTVVGFVIAKSVFRNSLSVETKRNDLLILCILSFLVMFFIHPYLSPLIWDRIL